MRRPSYRFNPPTASFKIFPPDAFRTISLLVTLSGLGSLARKGLLMIPTETPNYILPAVLPQALGCAIMGLVMFRKQKVDEWNPLLFSGLTVGLCGSITSFSSWMLATFNYLTDVSYRLSDRVLHSVILVIGTLSISYGFYLFGSHLARVRSPILFRSPPRIKLLRTLQAARFSFHNNRATSEQDVVATTQQLTAAPVTVNSQGDMLPLPLPEETSGHFHGDMAASPAALGLSRRPLNKPHYASVPQKEAFYFWPLVHLTAASYLLACGLVVGLVPALKEWAIVLLFAPLGTIIRWTVSWHFNWYPTMGGQPSPYKLRRVFRIPLGTLCLNVVGAAALSAIDAFQKDEGRSIVLVGVGEGLIGSMTTVSTLITELIALPRPSQKYTYFTVSWLFSWLFMYLVRL